MQVGTPICIPSQGGIEIGRIASMELNHKPVDTAKRGDAVAMKIEPANATEATRLFGRHFTEKVPHCGSLVAFEILCLSAPRHLTLLLWTAVLSLIYIALMHAWSQLLYCFELGWLLQRPWPTCILTQKVFSACLH